MTYHRREELLDVVQAVADHFGSDILAFRGDTLRKILSDVDHWEGASVTWASFTESELDSVIVQ